MTNSHVLLGAGIAGALLLAVPVLRMLFGAPGPLAVEAVVGVFGVVLLALWASASLPGGSHARP